MTINESDCSILKRDYKKHWDNAYAKSLTEKLGWYEEKSIKTLELIAKTNLSKDAVILNVGVGSSTIIDDLVKDKYTNIIANDLSENSLTKLKERLGKNISNVKFIVDDLTNSKKLNQLKTIDLWNDRAVLHFFLKEDEKQAYFNLIKKLVKPNGFVIIAVFALDGAEKCCGLELQRYNAEMIAKRLGDDFILKEKFNYTFLNPFGGERPYVYTLFQRKNQMKVTHIPFQKTGFFSKTMSDYLEQKDNIKPFYNNFPDVNGFYNQILEKQQTFSLQTRIVLSDALKQQYQNFKLSEKTEENIELLKQQNTFSVTTGHQLNLFTGPLYFLYKIISAINLAEELSEKFPKNNFVPVYWMATEDHDFEEINYFNFQGKKVRWNREDGGAVGRFYTDGLEQVFNEFANQLGNSKNANYLKELFSKGYLEHNNLADATRFIANELFTEYGLVIIDGDDTSLKNLFIPYIENELIKQTSFKEVSTTITEFEKDYKVQVNPREINLFYLTDAIRERILLEDGIYKVNNTDITWSKEEILNEVKNHSERFSPNVIMRPLFQEVILPNLCYIGGGGEQAYWLELKSFFDAVKVPFPILLLRNSVQVISKKQAKKLSNLKISKEELFLKQNDLLKHKVNENSDIQFSFQDAKTLLNEQFLALRRVANETDLSFVGAVEAQERKQQKGLENLEKRLLRAEKRKQKDLVARITALHNELLPNESLEERQRNFSEYYLEYGNNFIKVLKESLKPLQLEFTVIEMD